NTICAAAKNRKLAARKNTHLKFSKRDAARRRRFSNPQTKGIRFGANVLGCESCRTDASGCRSGQCSGLSSRCTGLQAEPLVKPAADRRSSRIFPPANLK